MRKKLTDVLAFLLSVFVFVLAGASGAAAQFETGSTSGTVRDTSGGVLPGVTVTLVNVETGVTQISTTTDSGVYECFTLRPGRYNVLAELQGFTPTRLADLALSIGGRQRGDIEMGVGLTEAVAVTAGSVSLERDSSQRGQVITSEQAVALPLNGREAVNGLRSTFNNFLLDGVDNNAYGTSNQGFSNQVMQPPPDAIAEFKVVTNNMSAEYGRSGGRRSRPTATTWGRASGSPTP